MANPTITMRRPGKPNEIAIVNAQDLYQRQIFRDLGFTEIISESGDVINLDVVEEDETVDDDPAEGDDETVVEDDET